MSLLISSQKKTDQKSRRIKRARMVTKPLAKAPRTKELLPKIQRK